MLKSNYVTVDVWGGLWFLLPHIFFSCLGENWTLGLITNLSIPYRVLNLTAVGHCVVRFLECSLYVLQWYIHCCFCIKMQICQIYAIAICVVELRWESLEWESDFFGCRKCFFNTVNFKGNFGNFRLLQPLQWLLINIVGKLSEELVYYWNVPYLR